MIRTTYTPIESLERIKLFMNYDSSKTLVENKQLLSVYDNSYVSDFLAEQNPPPPVFSSLKDLKSTSTVNSTVTQHLEDDNVLNILNGAIVDALRWIRRNAHTKTGMVVDVITAIHPKTTIPNKFIWATIVVFDIFELMSNTNDPLDHERNESPYVYLILDILTFLFTVSVAKMMKPFLMGTSRFTSNTLKVLSNLLKKLPKLKGLLKQFYSMAINILPKIKPIFDKVLSGIDKILVKIEQFITKLMSPYGIGGVAIANAPYSAEIKYTLGSKGDDVKKINTYLSDINNPREFMLDRETRIALTKANDNFTKDTEIAVKKYEQHLINRYGSKETQHGVINPDGMVSNSELHFYGIKIN